MVTQNYHYYYYSFTLALSHEVTEVTEVTDLWTRYLWVTKIGQFGVVSCGGKRRENSSTADTGAGHRECVLVQLE